MSNIITIPLSRGLFATISQEDYELVSKYRWYARKCKKGIYARSSCNNKIYMHRLIMGATKREIQVDHKDHDGLNNCRSNLRLATHSQNNFNARKKRGTTSKYKGVHWSTSKQLWAAQISINNRTYNLGRFKKEEDAAAAYNKRAMERDAEFALINDLS